MKTVFNILKAWLPLAVVTAGICGLVYLTVQQSLRMGANDPQIRMAEDAASALNGAASVNAIIPQTKVELSASLAPFMMIFDQAGNNLASSALLHGSVPVFSGGVLDYVRQKGEDRVTWQPEPGVRMAMVVVQYEKGFVMAGRSLREVEKRETQAEQLCGLALLAIWGVTFILVVLAELAWRKNNA